jgi:RNA polymerase sigma factor (TIGR02999 family)
MSNVTQILNALEQGDAGAAEKLLPLVYDELRRLAAQKLAHEKPGQTFEATALVHEAYMRLVGGDQDRQWHGRGHFFAAAAEAMRRILVDQARRKKTTRHGAGWTRIDLEPNLATAPQPREDLIALDQALDRLAVEDSVKAELVKLRYFAGLTLAEAAQALGMSERTAGRHWTYARAWLRRAVEGADRKNP